MATQRTFKRRVRARMTKTGESYTAARSQLIRKAGPETANGGSASVASTTPEPPTIAEPPSSGEARARQVDETTAANATAGADPAAAPESFDPAILPTSDESMQRATGRGYGDWFSLLDRWGARDKTHTETAAWLVADQAVSGWWAQSITVGYERARGLRAVHQVVGGYSIGANRTIGLDANELLEAVFEEGERAGWFRERPSPRRNSQGLGVRFDWSDPPSRVALFVVDKGPGKATISIQHEKLPNREAADRLKAYWRDWLGQLKAQLESGSA